MRAGKHEWLQFTSAALDEVTWRSYRGVIYFVLGTERARALWGLCSPYFNADFAEMVAEMIEDAPCIEFWDKLEAAK